MQLTGRKFLAAGVTAGADAYHVEGLLYLPAEPRFDCLLDRPEAENLGANFNASMRDTEKHNPQLAGFLPKDYARPTLDKHLLR